MAKTSTPVTAVTGLSVLERPGELELKSVYVVYGDEDFLRSTAVAAVRTVALGQGDGDDFGLSRFDGREAALADVLDELAMLPFLGARRVAVVQHADEFVSAHRDALERYVQKPSRSGVLVLVVQSWPGNTRLAKMVAQSGVAIDCKSPDSRSLAPWCRRWAKDRYGKQLGADAAGLLVELVGGGVGRLDSELSKLAAFVGNSPAITAADVDRLVASGRVEVVWNILDAATVGDSAAALRMLGSLTAAGEQPIMIFGAISAQLRKLARAYRLVLGGEPVRSALPRAGVPPYFIDKAQAQLRFLGRDRLAKIYQWLSEIDLGMKGDSSLSAQHLLERLLVRISQRPTEQSGGQAGRVHGTR